MSDEAAAPVTVALVEITEPTSNLNYLPYAAGLLQAYVLAHACDPQRYHFREPLFMREPIPDMADKLAGVQIAGFSVYTWNVNFNLLLAQALKRSQPETLIVFGGPQVPDDPTGFLDNLSFVDLVVHGEGEEIFLTLLERYQGLDATDWTQIPGISYRGPDGRVMTNPRPPRIADLSTVPSPYLTGLYEPIMARYPDKEWAVIWETNRGCPFSCTFCDWGSYTASKVRRFDEAHLFADIEWFSQHRIGFVFCADANFGILPRDIEFARRLSELRQVNGYPKRLVTQMTKNKPERAFEAHKLMHDAGMLVSATLSLQSITPAVLKAIKRDNISLDVYQELLKRFVAHGIPTYTDILIGLPGETFDSFADCLSEVIAQGQHGEVRIWNALLFPNAEMAAPEYRRQYGIQSVIVPCHPPDDPAAELATGIREECEMIIATNTLPHADWLRSQALAWTMQMLYFSRLLQLPLLLVRELTGLTHRQMLMAFCEDELPPDTPLQGFIRAFLFNHARQVASGQTGYCPTLDPATGQDVWVAPHGFPIAQLLLSGQLGSYYQECGLIIESLLQRNRLVLPPGLLAEALHLAHSYFQGLLEQGGVTPPGLSYNLLECFYHILKGEPIELKFFGRPYKISALATGPKV